MGCEAGVIITVIRRATTLYSHLGLAYFTPGLNFQRVATGCSRSYLILLFKTFP